MGSTDSIEQKPARHQAQSSIFEASQKRGLIFCLLLALAILALYNPVTRAPFLNFDDDAYVTENLHVRAGINRTTVVWAFRSLEASNWHPITWLSHALDCQIFGLNPAGPHTVNVLLHAANTVLLFLILLSATGLAWRSLMIASLFALHPINVESVAWIAERKNVLSMFFFLIALAAYGWYVRRPGVGRYLAVTSAYALALMAKPQVITFPFVLLLLDYWPLRRLNRHNEAGTSPLEHSSSFWSLLWEKVPWLALSAVSAVITMKVQAQVALMKLPFWMRLENAAASYAKYLGKAFWPINLAPLYPHPLHSISVTAAVLSAILLTIITTLIVIHRQRRPFFVGWFWFLGTLVPMIGLVQVGTQSMADRYAYIPLLGVFVIVCWGAADLLKKWHVPTAVSVATAAVVLVALGIGLHRQVSFWKDNLTLWTHTLDVTEGNYTAEDNLATALIVRGKDDEALPHLQHALLLQPDDAVATLDIANYERLHGNYQAALEGFAKIPRLTRDPLLVARAQLNSGYSHYVLKQYDSARKDFEAVLIEQPESSVAYRALGLIAQRAGNLTLAAQDYQRSVDIEPTSVGYLLLAQALQSIGQPEAARTAESQAARHSRDLNPDIAIVRQLMAN
jgi:Flp pilus assembly protein TadD